MKTELEKKKKVFGLLTGATFLVWLFVEMLMIWRNWQPLWNRIEWMVDEGLMSQRFVLDCFLAQIGKTNVLFYLVMGLSSLIFVALAFGGAKKERLNLFAVTAVFTIFATDAIRVIMALKKLIFNPVTVGMSPSISKILYVLGGGCATAIWFFAFVMAVVSATGNSIFKKAWYVPGVLYLIWAAIYFFAIPMVVAYKSEMEIADAIALSDINHFLLGGGIILLGYWMSLFMPERRKDNGAEHVKDNEWTADNSGAGTMGVDATVNSYNNGTNDNVVVSRQNSLNSKQNKMQ